MLIVGIDIGTTSICGVLYDTENDRIIQEVHEANQFLSEGSFLQDAEKIVRKAEKLIAGLVDFTKSDDLERPEGIGITSQMHGILYVDREGRAVSPFYTWKNEYGNEDYKNGLTYAQYLSRKTGSKMHSGYGSVTHFYLQEKGKILDRAAAFVNIGNYLAMRLTGEKKAAVDMSIAASFGGFRLERGEFDLKTLKKVGVNTNYYPEVTEESLTGRDKNWGIPVYYAIGDNQASFLGAIQNKEESISINIGTGSQISIFSQYFYQEEGVEVRPFGQAGYLYVGASLNGGKVYERLAVFIEEICKFFTGKEVNVYEKMQQIGEQKKETDLLTVPGLYGNRMEEENISGFFHLTEENFHGADMIRSFVAGMAKELYDLYSRFPEKIKEGKNVIIASGNGIRKNGLLKEELEKIFQMPVFFTNKEEAAAGAALFALKQISKEVILN